MVTSFVAEEYKRNKNFGAGLQRELVYRQGKIRGDEHRSHAQSIILSSLVYLISIKFLHTSKAEE